MKKALLLSLSVLTIILFGCQQETTTTTSELTDVTTLYTGFQESPCKDTPLATDCYVPSDDLNFISPIPDEYVITEDFETETLNQIPRNWLIFSNAEYKANGVFSRVREDGDNKYVEMYSDGLQKPLYPQSAPTPTFIFTTKFNLDIARKGVAYASVMVPSTNRNAVTVGVATGAVNTISVTIDTNLSVFVKVGGAFYYYSLNGDGGDYFETALVVTANAWYDFKFEWDAEIDSVKAYWINGETEVLLHEDTFHVSNRFNGVPNGEILVPNVFKVTMPYGRNGFAYLDNVIVERMEE